MTEENKEIKKDGIKREYDGIRLLVTEAGTYKKRDDRGNEIGEPIPVEAGIKIITNYGYVKVTPLFVASVFQALSGHDKELLEEVARRLEAQKEELRRALAVTF